MLHDLKKDNLLGDLYRVRSNDFWAIEQLLKQKKPFIITNLSKDWKASKVWTLDYFNEATGKNIIHYVSMDEDSFTKYGNGQIQKMPFSNFIQELKKTMENSAKNAPHLKKLYLIISRIAAHGNRPAPQLPELLKDIQVPGFIPIHRLWTVNLWVGGGNNKSNLHFDPDHNLLVPIKGTKELILISPSQTKFLYQNLNKNENRLQSKVNIFKIEREKWPDIDRAFYYQTKVEEGEGLYIPSGWWHGVASSPGVNIAINFWWLPPPIHLLKITNPARKIQWNLKKKWLSILFPSFISKHFKVPN